MNKNKINLLGSNYKTLDYPIYYVSGEEEAKKHSDFVEEYYKVKGPNGPVSHMTPNTKEPSEATMQDLIEESINFKVRQVTKEETPYNNL